MKNKDTERNKDHITEDNNYQFMEEVIKKKSARKGQLVKRFLFVLICAAGAAAVGGFVFFCLQHALKERFEKEDDSKRVEVIQAQVTTPQPTATPTPEPTKEPSTVVITEEKKLDLEDYSLLNKEMHMVADSASKSLVEVIGITGQMDYLNQTYYNQSQVTGMIVADNGDKLFVLVDTKAILNAQKIQVTFYDGTIQDASLIRTDSVTGFSVISVSVSALSEQTRSLCPPATLGYTAFTYQGDPVIAIGSPTGVANTEIYGNITSVLNTVSEADREYSLITTSILGDSNGSGVLINLSGEVVGIIAQKYHEGSLDIVTALSISQMTDMIESLSNNEERPYIGIVGQDVTEQLSGSTGIPQGVLVLEAVIDSPSMLAGIKQYDVITAIGDQEVQTMDEYQEALKLLTPGQEITVKAMRKGAEGYAEITFPLTVGAV